jgi:uncharacterized membrane protein
MVISLSVLMLVLTVGLLGWMLRLGRASETFAPDFEPPSDAEMRGHLYWRVLYVNPGDPRGWVPKIYGIGYTVNFRTEANARRFLLLIAAILLCAAAQVCTALICLR